MTEPMLVPISPEVALWLALRRVQRGRVAVAADLFTDEGRPLPGYLNGSLRELFDNGQVRLGEGDRTVRPVVITDSGEVLLAELTETYGAISACRPSGSGARGEEE